VGETETDPRPLVCVDLDGVLNLFDTWQHPEYFHPVRPGAREFLIKLNEAGFRVCVLTVRWFEWVERWLAENDLASYVDCVTDKKPPAQVYLDDRAVCFRGDFDQALNEIVNFRPFWEQSA
jgi:hypothetical protein